MYRATAPTTETPIRPPVVGGNMIQTASTAATATSRTSTGRTAARACGCRWRTTSSSSASTSSGNATRSAYVQHVPRGDTSLAVSRTDQQLAVTVHRGRRTGDLSGAGQQHPHVAPDRGAVPLVRRQQP